MKKLFIYLTILLGAIVTGCNDLPDEQFEKYAVFIRNGFHEWHMPFNNEGEVVTNMSISVSGTSTLTEDMDVEIAVNEELLKAYNFEKFRNDVSSYYILLPTDCYELETTKITVNAGDEYALIPIKLNLDKMDKYLNYILPVEIVSVSKYNVGINGYNESLINFVFDNEYSGLYTMAVDLNSSEGNLFINGQQSLKTVGKNTCFFPVSYLDKESEKKNYNINVTVNSDSTLTLSANNPDIEFDFATPDKGKNNETNIIEITETGKNAKTMKFYLNYSYLDKSNPEVNPVRRNIRGSLVREIKLVN